MQSIDLIETYACRTSKDQLCKKENIKRNNIIKQFFLNFFDLIISQKKTYKNRIHNGRKFEIYRILTIGGFGSRKQMYYLI